MSFQWAVGAAYRNAAYKQPTIQQTTYSATSVSSLAVDGDMATRSCTIWNNPQPWWAVDLGYLSYVDSVQFTCKCNCNCKCKCKSVSYLLIYLNLSFRSRKRNKAGTTTTIKLKQKQKKTKIMLYFSFTLATVAKTVLLHWTLYFGKIIWKTWFLKCWVQCKHAAALERKIFDDNRIIFAFLYVRN